MMSILNSYECFSGNLAGEDSTLTERYKRNLRDDLQTALDLAFKFKEDIRQLHPDATHIISRMLA